MNYLHYLSDFTLTINGVGFPDYDFTVELFTDGATVFTASYIDGIATNVANVGGAIHVIADGHGMGTGYVIARLTRYIPDVDYPDGYRTVVDRLDTDIMLITSSRMYKPDADEDVDSGISFTLASPFGTATFAPDDGMYRLHYQSDFTLAVNGIKFPDYDFAVELFADGSSVFTASYIDGVATNIANVDGVIHIIADGHGLGSGTVIARLTRHIPDADYPDGYRTVVDEAETDVELVVAAAMPVPGEDNETVGGITGTLVSPFNTLLLVTEDEESYIVTEEMEQYIELLNT